MPRALIGFASFLVWRVYLRFILHVYLILEITEEMLILGRITFRLSQPLPIRSPVITEFLNLEIGKTQVSESTHVVYVVHSRYLQISHSALSCR